MGTPRSISEIWSQRRVPVAYRSGEKGDPLWVRLPYRADNYDWLRGPRTRKPKWDADRKFWTVPTAWFDELVESAAHRYGSVYVIQPHRRMEKCAPACWNAAGIQCSCSCLSLNHGEGHPRGRWYEISDALAVQWNDRELYWRLLKPIELVGACVDEPVGGELLEGKTVQLPPGAADVQGRPVGEGAGRGRNSVFS
jgi:hypothetical protein